MKRVKPLCFRQILARRKLEAAKVGWAASCIRRLSLFQVAATAGQEQLEFARVVRT